MEVNKNKQQISKLKEIEIELESVFIIKLKKNFETIFSEKKL